MCINWRHARHVVNTHNDKRPEMEKRQELENMDDMALCMGLRVEYGSRLMLYAFKWTVSFTMSS